MSAGNTKSDKTEAWVHSALRAQKAVWTPQCPAPDTLLDWMERKDAHPQAGFISSHFITCAYCRRYHADLCKIRAKPTLDLSHLPVSLKALVSKLAAQDILAPVDSLLASFEKMKELLAPPAMVRFAPSAQRSDVVSLSLRSTLTAVRSSQPTLQWEGDTMAQTVEVVILHADGRQWQGRAPAAVPFTVPEEAGLEPEGIYEWQVIAHSDAYHEPLLSPTAAFVVLSEALAQQVTELERAAGENILARISIYETYGLYDDALQALERVNPADREVTITRLHAKLLQRLQQ